jgi:hypothetical protein
MALKYLHHQLNQMIMIDFFFEKALHDLDKSKFARKQIEISPTQSPLILRLTSKLNPMSYDSKARLNLGSEILRSKLSGRSESSRFPSFLLAGVWHSGSGRSVLLDILPATMYTNDFITAWAG